MKIKSIELKNIKGFKELFLDDLDKNSLVVLVGGNGSGKSTLFDAMNFFFYHLAKGGWLYNSEEIIRNNEEAGSISIELVFNKEELKEIASLANGKSTAEICYGFERSGNSPRITKQTVNVQDIRDRIINKRYSVSSEESNVKNFGIYIHRTPYRYEEVKDISDPLRDQIVSGNDKNRNTERAQNQSSRWQVVLSHLLQLDRVIKSKYFEVSNKNLRESVPQLKEAVDNYNKIIEDFNFLLEDRNFSSIEETTDSKTFFWIESTKNHSTKIQFKQLSSGEKEALFLFSDIRRQNPNFSIIAVDEPELHLHYNLQKKLIDRFLNLGEDNQIFLATHSVAIVRAAEKSKQAKILYFKEGEKPEIVKSRGNFLDMYKTVADDLAGVLANENVIFVEGEDDEKDVSVYSSLFDDPKLNFIPAKNCHNVTRAAWLALHLVSQQTTPQKLFAIIDGDARNEQEKADWQDRFGNLLVLNRYSIENYFFDYDLWSEIKPEGEGSSYEEKIKKILGEEQNIQKASDKIIGSRKRLLEAKKHPKNQNEIKKELFEALNSNADYLKIFPMKEFLGEIANDFFGMSREDFKKIIIKLMKEKGRIPEEIKCFIEKIKTNSNET